MRRLAPLLALCLLSACAPQDRLAPVKKEYPGAAEYLLWTPSSPPRTDWLLIRYAPEPDGARRALLLQRAGPGWELVAESQQGFLTAPQIMTYLPQLDESGVAAFHLK